MEYKFLCLTCGLKANEDPLIKIYDDLVTEDDNKNDGFIVCKHYEKEIEVKKPNKKRFINNSLCIDCYNNEWRCNFCKIKVNQYDGSFFNSKLCNKCYMINLNR